MAIYYDIIPVLIETDYYLTSSMKPDIDDLIKVKHSIIIMSYVM